MSDANWLFEQNKNATLISTVCFVLLGLVQSQIRNHQSAIHNSPSWRPQVPAPATYLSGAPRLRSRIWDFGSRIFKYN